MHNQISNLWDKTEEKRVSSTLPPERITIISCPNGLKFGLNTDARATAPPGSVTSLK